jgi:hypothetical protein
MKNAKTFLDRAGQRICDLIDESLYGRELAVGRAHQVIVGEFASQPVPYALTSLAGAALEGTEQGAR